MKKIILIFIILAILLLIAGFSYFFLCKKGEEESVPAGEIIPMEEADKTPEKSPAATNGARIAMIIAFEDFRDEEYFTPRRIFDEAKAEVKVVSDEKGTALGADGGNVGVDIRLSDLNVSDFDAIVFIGGPGALTHLDDQDSYKIAQDTVTQNKLLASICISPVILAKAGVLRAKRATVWTSVLDKSGKKVLEENMAIYQDEDIVQDGNIITASGSPVAESFAKKIIEVLSE